MTSRTPIRLTPHRGPLATPSASPESSPTTSTPPTDISYCSTTPDLDISLLQDRISALNLPTQHQCLSRPHHLGQLFGRYIQLKLAFGNLVDSTCAAMNAITGTVTICLLFWGILEWYSHASGLPGQTNLRLPRLPLPSYSRTFPSHGYPLYEPGDRHAAVAQFLSEQIQHAKALSSLSIDLGLPLHTFFEAHRSVIPSITVRRNRREPHLQEAELLANLTDLLGLPILDFTPGSFIGRSFTLALDELGGISESVPSHRSPLRGGYSDGRLQAIYWRTMSNLLLEYSAARPRARGLLQHVRTIHQQLSPIVMGQHAAQSIVERSDISWWEGIFRPSANTIDGGMQAFVTGLEVTIDNIERTSAYLDWITDHLARTNWKDVSEKHPTADFWSCSTSLQELFVRSRPPPLKKHCQIEQVFTLPRKVDVMVPGSPTVRAGR